jgi:predicted nucleic acid-binding protein
VFSRRANSHVTGRARPAQDWRASSRASFWSAEVLNTLLLGERKGRISPEQTKAFFDTLGVLNPILDFVSLEQVTGPVQLICRDHRLTPYDALYVELALRSGYPLATLDQPQRDAAMALGVHCL